MATNFTYYQWQAFSGYGRRMRDHAYLIHSVYGPQVQPFRLALAQNEVWRFLDMPDPLVLELFLIQYCALGVAMTQPVPSWIRRAGERCQELGYADVAAFLASHANPEQDHHSSFVDDTRYLVNRWNAKHERQLNAERLLSQPLTDGVVSYRALHEASISRDAPYCQLAIEFEIERLSTTYGVAAMTKIARVLGPEAIKGLGFLENRVKEGLQHTSVIECQLNQLLHDVPTALSRLTETARMALMTYGEYLSDCLALASEETIKNR
jgi:hypothetical protein